MESFYEMFSASEGRNWQSWAQLFSPAYFDLSPSSVYRPLPTIFYWASWKLFRTHIWIYQLIKVLSVSGIAWLVYLLARKFRLGKFWSLAAAMIYACHPFHAEEMLQISHVDDIFMTFFCLLAFGAHVQRWKSKFTKILWLGIFASSYILALASKETAVVLPCLMLVFDCFLSLGGVRKKMPWERYCIVLAITGVYLLSLILWIGNAGFYGKIGFVWESPPWKPAFRLFSYIAILFEPVFWNADNPHWLAPAIVMAVVMLGSQLLGRNRKRALFFWAWIVLGLLPLINIAPFPRMSWYLSDQAHPTRYLILPGIAFCWLIADLLKRCGTLPLGRVWAPVLACLLIFANIESSHAAAHQYKKTFLNATQFSHFTEQQMDSLRDSPFLNVLPSLPLMLKSDLQSYLKFEQAVRQSLPGHRGPTIVDFFSDERIYKETSKSLHVLAALLEQGFKGFHHRLTNIYSAQESLYRSCGHVKQNDWGLAVSEFKRALELCPGYVQSHLARNPSDIRLKNPGAAKDLLQKLCGSTSFTSITLWYSERIQQSNELKDAGVERFLAGNVKEAMDKFHAALDFHPENIQALLSLGASLALLNRLNEALDCYDKVIRIRPQRMDVLTDALGARARVWMRLGLPEKAEKDIADAHHLASSSWARGEMTERLWMQWQEKWRIKEKK